MLASQYFWLCSTNLILTVYACVRMYSCIYYLHLLLRANSREDNQALFSVVCYVLIERLLVLRNLAWYW